MKIASWNVNGIAARRRDLIKFLKNVRPDVLCVQEVKTQCSLNAGEYEQYWNTAQQKGSAGTLVLSRRKPLSWTTGIGVEKFDAEGRTITLEFKDFFVVCVYVPSFNTASPPERKQYRLEWDSAFREYAASLPKPAILCGDYNIVREPIDTYPDNTKSVASLSFQIEAEFREGFERLIAAGFADAFRVLNPWKDNVYSWWGPKNNARADNRGSRLDYILVSDKLLGHVASVKYHKDILGSDHCPVSIIISPPKLYSSEDQERLADRWQSIDWGKMRELLYDAQKKLAEAAYMRDWALVAQLQQQIVSSLPARALAVRSVTDKNTAAGVDGVKWESFAEKAGAMDRLTARGYHPLPYRHKEITDDNGRRREIHIPTSYDKAMQTLYAYALDPISESTADKRSFSGRKGRSALDAHAYLQRDLEGATAPEWIVKIDVKSFYEKIIHDYMQQIIPMDKAVLRKFLKAGVVKDGQLFETEQGISLGSPLSPILANMLLDGLQTFLYDQIYPQGHTDYLEGCMTRYADDIVILARSQKCANLILQVMSDFLARRGLCINDEKSGIFHISEGFDFVGRHYIKKDGVLEITPCDDAVKRFEHELEELIQNDKSTYRTLIGKINDKLSRWAKHHRSSDAYMVFRHIDAVVEGLLLRKLVDRHPYWKEDTVYKRYWVRDGAYYVFSLPEDRTVRVIRLAPLNIVQHKPCKTDFNPYFDQEYAALLKKKRNMQKAVDRYAPIWERQDGKCAYCNQKMLPDQEVEVVERTIGRGWRKDNLIYIHKRCSDDMYSSVTVDDLEHIDLFELLDDLLHDKPVYTSPYWGLREYFRLCEKPVVTLTFQQIEEIIGEPLSWEAGIHEGFWYDEPERAGYGWQGQNEFALKAQADAPAERIADAWISQGYRLQRLHLTEKRIVLHRAVVGTRGLRVPSKLLQQRLPDKAIYELETAFKQVIRKYGL